MHHHKPVLAFVWAGELDALDHDTLVEMRRRMPRRPRTRLAAFMAARGPQHGTGLSVTRR